ncbi:MAG: LysR family transcriptional regulator [Betaproteobacteria bacterium]|nr:LysR family transcriptional regulator [Betaproteobacteria bacterium]
MHLTPQTISGQISVFEALLGYRLFTRAGRRLELTDAGRMAFSYADEIFTLGEELEGALRSPADGPPLQFRAGVSDAVPKVVAHRLLEPAVRMPEPLRMICREGKLASLLADPATNRLDIVIADAPVPASVNIKGFNHLLGECGVTFFATAKLARGRMDSFPRSLDGAPMLLPGEDAAVRPRLMRWFEAQRIRPCIAGEFDDGGLLKAFGRAGVGIFPAPTAIARQVRQQYGVVAVGQPKEVSEAFYAISVERRLTHPAVLAITSSARKELFRRSGM